MAGVVRLVQQSALGRSIILSNSRCIRLISTSKKNRETVGVAETVAKSETTESTTISKKNWVSFGFDFKNEEADRDAMHATFFCSITLGIVFGGFVWAYYPDILLRDGTAGRIS
jgi:NADH dehydrogenase (ubiquinone) 1 beta subcomplex subunit 11